MSKDQISRVERPDGVSRRGFLRTSAGAGAAMLGGGALFSWGQAGVVGASASSRPAGAHLASSATPQRALVALQSALSSLDPPLVNAIPLASAVRHVIQSFVEIDADGKVVPILAESWEVADDKQTWTMHLRPGVLFHDGSPWTAEVAKLNLDRYLGNPDKFPRAQQYAFIDGVTALDDLTLELHTAEPHSGFLNWTSYFAMGFHSGAALDEFGDDVATKGVGTGPFMVREFVVGERLELVRFDDYWGGAAPLDELAVQTAPDASGRVAMLEAGEAQFITAIPAAQAPIVEGNGDLTLLATPSVRMVFVGINSQHEDLGDVRVRQALNYAVDSQAILDVVLQGRGTLATSVMPEIIPGHAAQSPYDYDPERAAELLDEAGWVLDGGKRSKDGRQLQLTINTTDGTTAGDRPTCEAIQAYLTDVGISVDIQVNDQNTYFATMQAESAITDTTLNFFGFGSNIVHATHALDVLNGSWSNINSIYARYRSEEFDAALAELKRTVDDEVAFDEVAARAQEIAWSDAPWIFLFSLDSLVGHSNDLEGAFDTPHEFWNLTRARRS